MAVPAMTKEEIFPIKDLNTIYNERKIDEIGLDDLVEQWINETQGFVKGVILESYFQYIDTYTWKVIIKMYCKWQSLDMMYSTLEQELVNNAYIALIDFVNRINTNVTNQAKLSVIPNKSLGIKVH